MYTESFTWENSSMNLDEKLQNCSKNNNHLWLLPHFQYLCRHQPPIQYSLQAIIAPAIHPKLGMAPYSGIFQLQFRGKYTILNKK
ncbi:hypothetical protein HYPBUDRAFT_207090 [Hyphopichia burtonii NRRL Y-1933]|uniref:Uncharacterized protein n=1 Tax=Hyphopichia burtonii NRRL Y-1933 TaxID=984485 RepID=A0A1E4RIE1_9ASCO|nr:hypothetical protein HYPBUDRAFT_207090 [Hyphopichia burtonii NRRL Y-1933]ODV67037.1 hypothetical protein HYPBUDRAFT_207090 [Hyphopichia burtonii NRRL Y-1933]